MEGYLKKFVEIADQMGLEIVDVQFEQSDLMALRLAHKNHDPVDLDTCVEASRAFGEAIDYAISLDVSSAGAEREIDLEDIESVVGRFVLVKFTQPMQGGDYVEGDLLSYENGVLEVEYQVMHRKKTIQIDKDNVAMLRLAVKV